MRKQARDIGEAAPQLLAQRRVEVEHARDTIEAAFNQYRRLLEGSFAWATPVSFDVHALAVDGDLVLSDWTIRARRCDDGVEVEWRGLSVCELRDDRIVWWREHHLAPPQPVA